MGQRLHSRLLSFSPFCRVFVCCAILPLTPLFLALMFYESIKGHNAVLMCAAIYIVVYAISSKANLSYIAKSVQRLKDKRSGKILIEIYSIILVPVVASAALIVSIFFLHFILNFKPSSYVEVVVLIIICFIWAVYYVNGIIKEKLRK
tara:strand:- start:214 stop:657 length:444 start_codon:yes stop_codon:yes gene_type:complete